MSMRIDIAWSFATPIIGYRWDDGEALNAELATLIARLEDEGAGVRRSNAGGWQSADSFLSRDEPCVKTLKKRITALVRGAAQSTSSEPSRAADVRFRLDCWANVNRAGDYNIVHSHPNALWSGVYYVAGEWDEDPDTLAGKLEILDPREAASYIRVTKTRSDERMIICPQPGMVVLFPSWIKHMVHPYDGPERRISIAFNATPFAPLSGA
ncbi:MAG: 2OG-Fe(II) oxygenase family protein [Caulobacterales bacterium]|nr:2OG-Fe(II) oxygenase family protein [Caulobacterales bacterium]